MQTLLFRLFIETERERRLTASKEINNTVMEMTKPAGGALVRIGDLHTGRRFNNRGRLPVLPPLELRIKDKGNPKVIRLAVNQNKILLAPLGEFWKDANYQPVDQKPQPGLITSRFQKFYCHNNSYHSFIDD